MGSRSSSNFSFPSSTSLFSPRSLARPPPQGALSSDRCSERRDIKPRPGCSSSAEPAAIDSAPLFQAGEQLSRGDVCTGVSDVAVIYSSLRGLAAPAAGCSAARPERPRHCSFPFFFPSFFLLTFFLVQHVVEKSCVCFQDTKTAVNQFKSVCMYLSTSGWFTSPHIPKAGSFEKVPPTFQSEPIAGSVAVVVTAA